MAEVAAEGGPLGRLPAGEQPAMADRRAERLHSPLLSSPANFSSNRTFPIRPSDYPNLPRRRRRASGVVGFRGK